VHDVVAPVSGDGQPIKGLPGALKPPTDGGLIPLAGVIFAHSRQPLQKIQGYAGYKKTAGLTGAGPLLERSFKAPDLLRYGRRFVLSITIFQCATPRPLSTIVVDSSVFVQSTIITNIKTDTRRTE